MLDSAALAAILDPERKLSISVFEHIEAYQVVIDNRRKKQVKDDPNHTAVLVAAIERIAMDKSKQAFPVPYEHMGGGMTLREYAAVAAMQGISLEEYTRFGLDACINFAVQKADALLARLEESK